MRFLKNRKFQIILIIVVFIIVAVLSINRFSGINIIRNLVTIPVSWIQKGVNDLDGYFTELSFTKKQYSELLKENEALKNQNEKLREQNAVSSFLKEDNILLREALNLKDIFEGYEAVGTNIMGSDPGNFVYRYKIDIGTRDKVRLDMPVVAANNTLYGRILLVNYTTAVIAPIIDEDAGVSGWISKTNGGHVNIRGAVRYKEEGLCIIENVSDEVVLEVGDVVETSGLGGIYPKGILVGVIKEVLYDETTNEQFGVLEPYVDFNSISIVFVLMEKTE